MNSIYEVAKKLKKYPQVFYSADEDILVYKLPKYRVTYTHRLITIYYASKTYEYTVGSFEEGYYFFKWLAEDKISFETFDGGLHLIIRDYNRLHRKKSTKRVNIFFRIFCTLIGLFVAAVCVLEDFLYLPQLIVSEGLDLAEIGVFIFLLWCMVMAVFLIVHVNARHPMTSLNMSKLTAGMVLSFVFSFMPSMMFVTRNEEPTMPTYGAVIMIIISLPIVMAGIRLVVSAFMGDRKNPNRVIRRKPQFPPFEQAKALCDEVVADSPDIMVLCPICGRVNWQTVTDSKIGGEMYFDENTEYPYDEKNKVEFYPILQLNLAMLPENDMFPCEGILQLFVSPNGERHTLIYHKTFDNPIKIPHISEDAISVEGCKEEVYAYGEVPIRAFIRKAVFYNADYASALMKQIADSLGITLSEDLLFSELANFVGVNRSEKNDKDSVWAGVVSRENGSLSVTLISGSDKKTGSGIHTGKNDTVTWKIRESDLRNVFEHE